ncbi:MAG: hypothetical protein CMQ05_00500, partial [Gammaproteobacteria bacterium]
MSQTPDFGEPVDRHGTGSSKFNKYPSSVIPLWVADMDFRIAPPIAQVLHDRVDHGVFGYGDPADELVDVIQARLQKRYDWSVDPDEIRSDWQNILSELSGTTLIVTSNGIARFLLDVADNDGVDRKL